MSKIDDLIKEYCGDGVAFRELGKVLKPKENISWKLYRGNSYKYIDLSSVDRVTHKISETTEINFENAPSRAQQIVKSGDVIFGTTRPTLKRFCIIDDLYDGQIASTGFCVLRPSDEVLTSFLFHLIGSSRFNVYVENTQKGASYPSISDAEVKKFKIPVPPIEVQREIVNILDKFTQLETELETELEARKKQYEYYRNILVDVENSNSTALTKLIDVCKSISSGKNKSKNKVGSFPVFGSTGVIGYTESPKYKHDTLLVARVGANAGYVHKSYGDYDVSDNTLIVDLKDNVNLDYIYYLLVALNLNQYATGGGQPLITGGKLKEIIVPIPPIEKQNRIASTLNNFDKLVNDISVGLPAELNARRKQYEYYRDKLLTFEELNV